MNIQDLRNKIADYQSEIDDKSDHLNNLDKMLTVSMWLTFLLYLAFALSLYVGDIWHLQTLISSFAGGSFAGATALRNNTAPGAGQSRWARVRTWGGWGGWCAGRRGERGATRAWTSACNKKGHGGGKAKREETEHIQTAA